MKENRSYHEQFTDGRMEKEENFKDGWNKKTIKGWKIQRWMIVVMGRMDNSFFKKQDEHIEQVEKKLTQDGGETLRMR